MEAADADWVLLVRFPGADEVWGIQIDTVEVPDGGSCACDETGGVFHVTTAGLFNSAAALQGKRIVEFAHIRGDPALAPGFHLRVLGASPG